MLKIKGMICAFVGAKSRAVDIIDVYGGEEI